MESGARNIISTSDVLSGLTALVDAGGDLRGVLTNIGEAVRQSTIDRFTRQVSPAGIPWAPLNPDYAAGKKGPGILRETRRLSEIVYELGANEVYVGSSAAYAKVHQFGAVIEPRTAAALVFSLGGMTVFARRVIIPRREFLGLSIDDIIEIQFIIEDYYIAATRGAIERQ